MFDRRFGAEVRCTPPVVSLMQRDTVRYAKRQWTWFSSEPDIRWIDVDAAGGPPGVAAVVARMLRDEGLTA